MRNNKRNYSKKTKPNKKKVKKRKSNAKRRKSAKNMRPFIIAGGIALVLVVALLLVVNIQRDTQNASYYMESEISQIEEGGFDESVKIKVLIDGEVAELTLRDYLVGVVSAEMPASYDIEALKAQALAARTYTAHKMVKQKCEKNEEACICNSPAHCQAYLDEAALREKWGDKFSFYYNKIKVAVIATDGEVIAYNGELIEALYSASCAGVTEDCENVFSNAVPYLVSVESADSDEEKRTVSVSKEEYVRVLQSEYADLQLTASEAQQKTGEPKRFDSGRVDNVKIANAEISGEKMRKLFSLPSTLFNIRFDNDSVIFECSGYGHGVGLSQVGADGYAQQGYTAHEITSHYYTGTEIKKLENFLK